MILVTGGTGFVGSAIVEALLDAGHEVRVLTRRTCGDRARLHFVQGDITADGAWLPALDGCETVIHCAGEKRDVARMQSVNTDATRRLFEACARAGVRRFCHLSSVGVIGRVDSPRVDETTPCRPMNRYEETKLRAEEIVGAGLAQGQVVILRPTNVFGAATVAALARPGAAAWLKLALKGRENAHFVYVKDVAAAALHLVSGIRTAAVETCIVSSDEEPGNNVADIQRVVAAARPGAPRVPVALPAWVPYALRRMTGSRANRGDVVYSARRLAASGFRMPFGLAAGLRAALAA